MLKKKFFAKALAFAMVTGLMATAAPVGIQTWAEETKEEEATAVTTKVLYTDYTLEITPNGDNYVFVAVLKKADDDLSKATVYPYPAKGGKVIVDLSFLKAAKPSYLKVWGDKNTKEVSVTVNEMPAKVKAKYNAAAELKVADKDGKATNAEILAYYKDTFSLSKDEEYEFKTLYGSYWYDLADLDLDTTKVAGTTLVLRQKAVDPDAPKKDEPAVTAETEVKGAPAGTEVKVKIPASPKAPKVTIDYAKGAIKLPKNAEYGIINEKGELTYITTAATTPKEVLTNIGTTVKELKDTEADAALTKFVDENLVKGFTLVVRTNDEKKGASMPAFVTVKGSTEIKASDTEYQILSADGKTVLATYTFSEKDGLVLTSKDTSNVFEYQETKNGKTSWKKAGKGVKDVSELVVRIAGVKGKAKDGSDSKFPSVEVKITKGDASFKITNTTKTVVAESALTLTTEVKGKDGEAATDASITWKSSDDKVATVDKDGKVTGVAAGKVTITGTAKISETISLEATIEIEVTAKPAS